MRGWGQDDRNGHWINQGDSYVTASEDNVDPTYEAPALEALGSVEEYTTQGTDISIIIDIN